MAVLFITKIENNETKNEGLCLKCAKDMGIPQVDSILSSMGISEDDFDSMEEDLLNLMGGEDVDGEDADDDTDGDEEESEDGKPGESRTPSLDFSKIFNQFPFAGGFTGGKKSRRIKPTAAITEITLTTEATETTAKKFPEEPTAVWITRKRAPLKRERTKEKNISAPTAVI